MKSKEILMDQDFGEMNQSLNSFLGDLLGIRFADTRDTQMFGASFVILVVKFLESRS